MKKKNSNQNNDTDIPSPRRKQEFELGQHRKQLVSDPEKSPIERFSCNCSICQEYCRRSKITHEPPRPEFKLKLFNQMEKDFVFLLRRLLPIAKINRTLNIIIPDTVCFINGEPKLIVYNNRDGGQAQVRQIKDRLSLNQIRQFLNNRRKKAYEKYGEQQESMLERNLREAVLVKYDDDNSHVMNDVEFLNLMMRRKGDQFWLKVQFVQNFVRPRHFVVQQVKFNRSNEQHLKLFKRAAVECRQLTGELVKGASEYIPQSDEEQFQQSMKKNNSEVYLQYLGYKIIQYADIFYGSAIESVVFEWVRDDFDEYCLMNAFNIVSTEGEGVELLSEEWYYRTLENRAMNKLQLKDYHLKHVSKEGNARTQQWQNEMQNDFKSIQKEVGIDSDYFKIVVDNTSDNVFQLLHPQCNYNFKQIVGSNNLYLKMQKQLLMKKPTKYLQSKMLNTFFLSPPKRQSQSAQKHEDMTTKSILDRSTIYRPYNSPDVSDFKMGNSSFYMKLSRRSNKSASYKKTLSFCLGIH